MSQHENLQPCNQSTLQNEIIASSHFPQCSQILLLLSYFFRFYLEIKWVWHVNIICHSKENWLTVKLIKCLIMLLYLWTLWVHFIKHFYIHPIHPTSNSPNSAAEVAYVPSVIWIFTASPAPWFFEESTKKKIIHFVVTVFI